MDVRAHAEAQPLRGQCYRNQSGILPIYILGNVRSTDLGGDDALNVGHGRAITRRLEAVDLYIELPDASDGRRPVCF